MILSKSLGRKVINLIKERRLSEALEFFIDNCNIINKNKNTIKKILNYLEEEFPTADSLYFKTLKALLHFSLIQNKEKFYTDIVDLDAYLIVIDKNFLKIIRNIYNKFVTDEDLGTLIKVIFRFDQSEEKQKSKYFHFFILFSIERFFKKNIWFKYTDLLQEHINNLIQNDKEELLYVFNTIFNHILMNLAQTQEDFEKICDLLDKPLSNYIKKKYVADIKNVELNKNQFQYNKNLKRKIAIVVDKIVNNSPTHVLFSFLKNLMEFYKDKFEIYILDANLIEKVSSQKETIELFEDIGVKYIDLHDLIKSKDKNYNNPIKYSRKLITEEAYNFIKKKNIDILIFGNSLYLSVYLAARKAAPIQIYWSHGNANWNVNGIDIRISHFPQNSKYNYFIFEEPRLKEFFLGPNPKKEKRLAKQIRKKLEEKYGRDIIVLGTIGRAIKLQSEEYIKLICDVMKKYKNTIYLACGEGCDIVKDLVLKYGGEEVLNRWIFPGQVNPHIYGWVIDIWPDTFPLGQGKSLNEFEAKKGCTVVYAKEKVEDTNNLYYDFKINLILNKFGLNNFFTLLENTKQLKNISEYKKKLEMLIENTNYRKNISKLISNYYKILFSKEYRKHNMKLFYVFLNSFKK